MMVVPQKMVVEGLVQVIPVLKYIKMAYYKRQQILTQTLALVVLSIQNILGFQG